MEMENFKKSFIVMEKKTPLCYLMDNYAFAN